MGGAAGSMAELEARSPVTGEVLGAVTAASSLTSAVSVMLRRPRSATADAVRAFGMAGRRAGITWPG